MCYASRPAVAAAAPEPAMQQQAYARTPGTTPRPTTTPSASGNMKLDGGVSTGGGGRQTFGGNDPLMVNLGGGGASVVTGTPGGIAVGAGSQFGAGRTGSSYNAGLVTALVNARAGSQKVV